ncbi:MAG: bifunctional riboflavin kinase/FAD synthetase [Candidatus Eremiobacteraeota bacterium]|nr:bifunctional riboflavin kinase/FAD synthetase [Candidatus Eremiobacteraeota bacterium]
MDILTLEEFSNTGKRSSLALGFFDGIHLGHRKILSSAVRTAEKNEILSVVFTFKNHPAEVLHPGRKLPLISDFSLRIELISQTGINCLVVCDFDQEFGMISPRDFVHNIIKEKLHPDFIVVGRNYSFGYRAGGTPSFLQRLQDICNFKLIIEAPVRHRGIVISSSMIRSLVTRGDLKTASAMLGRTFSVHGNVIKGSGRGKNLGIPTANIIYPEKIVRPPDGVYAVKTKIKGKWLNSVANLGGSPTFHDKGRAKNVLEVHVLDKDFDLYGKEMEIELVEFIRPLIFFDTPKALIARIKKDRDIARKILESKIPVEARL